MICGRAGVTLIVRNCGVITAPSVIVTSRLSAQLSGYMTGLGMNAGYVGRSVCPHSGSSGIR